MKAWRDIDDITCRITPADIVGMRSTAVTAHTPLRYPFSIAPAHNNFACNQLTALSALTYGNLQLEESTPIHAIAYSSVLRASFSSAPAALSSSSAAGSSEPLSAFTAALKRLAAGALEKLARKTEL